MYTGTQVWKYYLVRSCANGLGWPSDADVEAWLRGYHHRWAASKAELARKQRSPSKKTGCDGRWSWRACDGVRCEGIGCDAADQTGIAGHQQFCTPLSHSLAARLALAATGSAFCCTDAALVWLGRPRLVMCLDAAVVTPLLAAATRCVYSKGVFLSWTPMWSGI